jgi:hypothetical protein
MSIGKFASAQGELAICRVPVINGLALLPDTY